jgi:hypothetical protein
MFTKYFWGFLLIIFWMVGCHNNQTKSADKSMDKDKKEGQQDVYKIRFPRAGDVCRYKDWFFGRPYATESKSVDCNSIFEDTLSNGNILYGYDSELDNLFLIKNIKTQKFYSVFHLPIYPSYKRHIPLYYEKFKSEAQSSRDKIKNNIYALGYQIRFIQYDIFRLLELQTINDTLPRGSIEKFFDEMFASVNFFKNKKNLQKGNTVHKYNYWAASCFENHPFRKDTNLVALKKFLKTPRAKTLHNYEHFLWLTIWEDDLLCYEVQENTFLVINKSNRIIYIQMDILYGEDIENKY